MLDQIQKLGLSISYEQSAELQEKLGDRWPSFLELVRSTSEDEAEEKLENFRQEMKSLGVMKLMAIHALMTDEQKDLLTDLL
jgi:hypothetical protein